MQDPPKVTIDEEKAIEWLKKGSAAFGACSENLELERDP